MTKKRFTPEEIWNSLLLAGGDELEHELWCVVIRRVATKVMGRALGKSPWFVADEERESLITTWQDFSIPHSADLAWAIGEYDYFRDMDLCWDEKLSLSGDACGYTLDVVSNLKDMYPQANDAVTEESVDEFYCQWRASFLRRVWQEAKAITPESAT